MSAAPWLASTASPPPCGKVQIVRPFDKGERKNKGEKPAAADGAKKAGKADRPAPISSAVADSEGKFSMTDIPVGKYMVTSRVKGVGGAKESVEVKAGETATVSLKLEEMKQPK